MRRIIFIYLNLFCLFFISFFPALFAQVKNQGVPFLKNFSSIDYDWHPQNFCVAQDQRGVMYFGNAYGILEYDGITWKQINLPNGISGISMASDSKGKIYIGSAGDIGFLKADLTGSLTFASLLSKIPAKDRNFTEILTTVSVDDAIVFSTNKVIFIYQDDHMQVIHPSEGNDFFYAGKVNNVIYYRESGKGLMFINNNKLELVKGGEYFAQRKILGMLPYTKKNQLLLLTSDGAMIYDGEIVSPWKSLVDDFIKRNEIKKVIPLKDNFFAIGTSQNGLMIFDSSGRPLQHIQRKNGLQSNIINDLYLDIDKNLWVALDHGISYLEINSPFTRIDEQHNVHGMGYTSYIYKNKIYLGTSHGLFVKDYLPYSNPLDPASAFKLIKNTEGQVLALHELNGVLVCGHNKGVFTIENDNAKLISRDAYSGGWIFRGWTNNSLMITGTYSGLEMYEFKNNTWVYRNKIKGFEESSRNIEIDDQGNIWIIHGNKGLYKVRLNKSLDSISEVIEYGHLTNFPPDFFNEVSKIKNEIVFSTDKGLYKYDAEKDKLQHYNLFNSIIGKDEFVNKIVEYPDGSFWAVKYNRMRLIREPSKGKFVLDETALKKLTGKLVGSYEHSWMYDPSTIFIGTQEGFINFDPKVSKKSSSFNTVIRKVELTENKDSILFAGAFMNKDHVSILRQSPEQIQKVLYENNAVRFTYAAVFFESSEKNIYQYYLENLTNPSDRLWSAWTSSFQKEYTNLREGDYIFHVRAMNVYDVVSDEAGYRFTILPPWYRTIWAYILYGIIFTIAVFVLAKVIVYKINKEKKRLQKEKEKELLLMEKQYLEETLKAENEIILLKNQKLESEVNYKNNELATLATNLSQKTEFLYQLKKDLLTISKENDIKGNAPLNELIKNIDKGVEFDSHWNQFQLNFDQAHGNFLAKLREKYPALKPADLLLCAYIKINKSNKEIASLLNVSVSAIEKRRYRLREKFNLGDDVLLTEFILQL